MTTFDSLTITVPGVPVSKGRPRTRVVGKFAQIYPDPKSAKYEKIVRTYGTLAKAEVGLPVLDEPLCVTTEAVLPIPKSYSKAKRDRCLVGVVRPTGRPDVDNLCKAALDALNGIVWRDDSLIVDLHVIKRYGREPMMIITIEPVALPLMQAAESEAA